MCDAFRPSKRNWCPSRLIEVGETSNSNIRLVVSNNNLGAVAYCALSYSWGSDQAIVLTSENLLEYQEDLPFARLPATIQDAISLTRTLGYSYLWVDALCIVQGSKADWETQSPQMSDLYGLAALTIAAAGSPSVTKPMFQRRDHRSVRPCVINVKYHATVDSNQWIVHPDQAERMVTAAFNENPLSRRGWTLQERILSPRVLMFGQNQKLWSCVTMEACETFPSGLDPRFSTPINELLSLANLRQRFMRLLYLGTWPSEFWYDIVQLYSKADLTVSSVKLVAMQGVVTRLEAIAQRPSDSQVMSEKIDSDSCQYVGGLWRDKNFRQNLLWRTKLESKRGRPDTYRAPSWSWAAIDAEITPYEEFLPWTWNKHRDLATILDVQVGLVQPDKSAVLTGQVESGYLNLECFCRPCYLMRNEKGDRKFKPRDSDAKIITAQSLLDMGIGTVSGNSLQKITTAAPGTKAELDRRSVKSRPLLEYMHT
jgi:hypothetical protein